MKRFFLMSGIVFLVAALCVVGVFFYIQTIAST